MRAVHSGIGQGEGKLMSSIVVMYSKRLVADIVSGLLFGRNVSIPGSSLWTCLRCLRRLPCCIVLSHFGQVIKERRSCRCVGPWPVTRRWYACWDRAELMGLGKLIIAFVLGPLRRRPKVANSHAISSTPN